MEEKLIEKLNESISEEEIKIMSFKSIAQALIKSDFNSVREQFIDEEAINRESESIFKLFIRKNFYISIKSGTSIVLLAIRILTSQEYLSLPLLDFIQELIDTGANVLKSDDEGNNCLQIMTNHIKKNFPISSFGFVKEKNLLYRVYLRLMNNIAQKVTRTEGPKSQYEAYITEAEEKWTEIFPSVNSPMKFEDPIPTFNDCVNFLKRTYPNGVLGTTFCSYFYGKVDVNMVNDNGQTIVSYLAKIGQLHQASIDLLLDHDFDFLSTTNGNSLTDELLKENSRDNTQLMDSILEAMRKQKVKSSSANGVYELSLEKYKDYKSDKEKAAKDKEIKDLKQKLEKVEIQNKKIPKLESRVTKLENELTDLRNLLKEMLDSQNACFKENDQKRSPPREKTLIPSRRSGTFNK